MVNDRLDWAEKYRPVSLDNVVGNKDIIDSIRRFVRNQNFPNVLCEGGAGCGKTTAMRLIAKYLKVECMEINAASQSGISMVRDVLEPYARTFAMDGSPFKIVILDQVDRLSTDAQQASLQLSEEASRYCKFLATTNNMGRLIEAYSSRFHVFRFQPIEPNEMLPALKRICRAEKVRARRKDLLFIASASRGDLRTAIKGLQVSCEGEKALRRDIMKQFVWNPPYRKIVKTVKFALDGEFSKAVDSLTKLLVKIQPKWFFVGINDTLFKRKYFTEEERINISLNFPEGNLHALMENDATRFLATLAKEEY